MTEPRDDARGELLSTNIVSVRFKNYPTPSGVDIPGAAAFADDGGEWRLSEKEIVAALRAAPAQPADAIRELHAEIERLRALLVTPQGKER